MEKYPKIPGSGSIPLKPGISFEKYDGTNVSAEWSRKHGWVKFGLRRRLFDTTDQMIGPAIPLFMDTYAESLARIFVDNKRFRGVRNMVAFFEFFGKESFAGFHKIGDPTQEVMLFDIWQDNFGMLGPRDFVSIFGNGKIARILYEGKPNGQFLDNVRNGEYDGPRSGEFDIMEGAVCKCGSGGKNLSMGKVKTHAYLAKLQEVYDDKWKSFWE